MLLSANLTSTPTSGSSSANQTDEGTAVALPGASWLSLVNRMSADETGKELINRLLMSCSDGPQEDTLARFTEDLRALLTAQGVAGEHGEALVSAMNSDSSWTADMELDELEWTIDELLQMSIAMEKSGNPLPLVDESLPSALSDWLGSRSAGEGRSSVFATQNAGLLNSVDSAAILEALADSDIQSDNADANPAEQNAAVIAVSLWGASELIRALPAEPVMDKSALDLASSAAFRSVRFSQHGDAGDRPDAGMENLAPSRSANALDSTLRSAIGQGLSASQTSSAGDLATASSVGVNNIPAQAQEGGFVVSRAEQQRMFVIEHAQQAQAQQQQQSATRTADSLPRFNMDTPFGQPGWPENIGRQLLVMSSQGISSAQIRLDPPELGSLTVKIQMSADQQTSVNFVSAHAVVRDVLEQQLSRLQDLFRDQGLNLQDVTVSDQSTKQGQSDGDTSGEQERGTAAAVADDTDVDMDNTASMRPEALIDYYA